MATDMGPVPPADTSGWSHNVGSHQARPPARLPVLDPHTAVVAAPPEDESLEHLGRNRPQPTDPGGTTTSDWTKTADYPTAPRPFDSLHPAAASYGADAVPDPAGMYAGAAVWKQV